jgi:hypothetical protein
MKHFFIIGFLFIGFFLSSQESNEDLFRDFNFIIHLSNNKLYREAEKEKDRLFKNYNVPQSYRDSINFFLGQAYYHSGTLSKARLRFMEISSDAPFLYYKGRFLSALIDAEQNIPDSALQKIENIELSTSNDINELRNFEMAGMALLKKDYGLFDSLSKNSKFTNPVLNEEFPLLQKYYKAEQKIKRKSALLAGTLSTFVPGLGKVYVGNNGQALATFLTCGLMGGVAFENYYRLGISHPQTILFSGIFALFYIGNIWGSAVSVQVAKIEKQSENKHNIMVSLKLPVRNFFN